MHTRFRAMKVRGVNGCRKMPNRVNPWFIWLSYPASWAGIRCRWEHGGPRENISIPVDFAWAMLNGILVSHQEFKPALYMQIMFANLDELFE